MAITLIGIELVAPDVRAQSSAGPSDPKVKCRCVLNQVQCPAKIDCNSNWGHWCKAAEYAKRCNLTRNYGYCGTIPIPAYCRITTGTDLCGEKFDCVTQATTNQQCLEWAEVCDNRVGTNGLTTDEFDDDFEVVE